MFLKMHPQWKWILFNCIPSDEHNMHSTLKRKYFSIAYGGVDRNSGPKYHLGPLAWVDTFSVKKHGSHIHLLSWAWRVSRPTIVGFGVLVMWGPTESPGIVTITIVKTKKQTFIGSTCIHPLQVRSIKVASLLQTLHIWRLQYLPIIFGKFAQIQSDWIEIVCWY